MANVVRSISVRLQAEVGNYVQGFQRAKTATGDLLNELSKSEQARAQFQQMGTGMVVAGAGIAAGLGLAAKAAIDWESAWAGVVKTVDGSDEQLAALEGDLREMARTLPATHGEIAAVAEAAGQLGVATEDVADFTRTMIDLGESTNLTADEAATAIAQLMNVMGTAPEHVDRLGAALVELGNNGASTEREIIFMAQRIAGAGAIVGASEADVLALANALASAGINVEAGGSAISRVLVNIADSANSGGEKLETFAEVAGMSGDQFAAAFADDPVNALNAFVIGLNEMNTAGEDVFGTLDTLGLSEIRTRDAMLRLAASGDLLTRSLDDGARAWDENTALTDEAGRRYGTTESQIARARNQINDFAITMGETLLPAIGGAAESLGGLVDLLGKIPAPVLSAATTVAALVGGLLLLGGTIISGITRVAAYREAMASLTAQGGATAVTMGRLNRGMRRTAVWAGRATVALIALQAAEAGLDMLRRGAADAELMEHALREMTRTTRSTGELARVFGEDLDDLTQSIKSLNDESFRADFLRFVEEIPLVGGLLTKAGSELAGLFGRSGGTFNEMADDVETLDRALTSMVGQGLAPEAWDLFQQLVVASGLAIGDIEDQMPHFVAAYKEWLLAQKTGAEGVTELGGAVSATTEEVEELLDAFDRLFGVQMDIDRATIAYKQGLRDLREELDDGTRTLDLNTQAGRDNASAILDQIDRVMDLREANIDNGMSIDEANEKYENQIDLIGDMLIERGFEEEAVRDLIDSYRDIPARVHTDVDQPGMEKALEETRLYNDLLFLVGENDEIRTIMALPNIDDRIAALDEYRNRLRDINGTVVSATVRTINENIVRNLGPNAPQISRRHGGVTLHARDGLLREAQVFTPAAPARFAFAEPETGGEAFIPRFGDRDRSLAIADVAAGWHGGRVVAGDGASSVGGPFQWRGARTVPVSAPEPGNRGSGMGRAFGSTVVEHQEVNVQAFSDRFSLRQVMDDLALEGAV